VLAHLLRGDLALERNLDVGKLRELAPAVVDDANPGGQAGKTRLPQHSPAELARRLGERDVVAALAERHRRLEARGRAADAAHLRGRAGWPDARGVPAAPPLLAHRRVLGTADRCGGPVARYADVAADALADVLDPALLDLHGQERVGDGGAGGAD